MKLLINLALVVYVLAAPVEDQKEVDKRRESTKETIQLESTLKRLAGENKKYFSNPKARPMPQVDGLEEKGSGEVDETPSKPDQKVLLKPLEEQLKEEQAAIYEEAEEQAQKGSENNEDHEEEHISSDDEALEDEIEAAQYPIPGPYGPGFESSHPGRSLEFEPLYLGENDRDADTPHGNLVEEEEGEEEPQDEEYFLEKVMETLRRHPELLTELMVKGQSSQDMEKMSNNMVETLQTNNVDEHDLQSLADYDDRVNAIQAELAAIRAESDPEFAAAFHRNGENEQNYNGDKESHIVAKKNSIPEDHLAIPKEYVEDSMESLNRYFNTYAEDHAKGADVPIM